MSVREDLHLDVARPGDLSLQVKSRRSERRRRFARRAFPGRLELLVAADDAHPFSTAASRGLEQDRITDVLRGGAGGRGIAKRLGPLGDRDLGLARKTARRCLLPEKALHLRGRTDEDQAGVGDRVREVGILREEPIAGVDRITARALRYSDDPRGVEVALAGRRGADRVRRVGGADVQRVAVDIAVDRGRADAEIVAGADDAERDLAAIGDEDGGERRSPLLKRDVAVLATRVRVPLGCQRA